MRKNLLLILSVVFSCFALNSCDAWEDENYDNNSGGGGSDGPGTILLLKKSKTVAANGVSGENTYTYDNQNRVTNVKTINNIEDVTSYGETNYQYPSENKVNVINKLYISGELVSTNTINLEILSSTTAKMTTVSDFVGEIISDITYSAPCGISKMVNTMGEMGSSTQTYEYFDNKCSFYEYLDGELVSTTFNDDKFSPFFDPMRVSMGLVSHNPIKIEEPGGTYEAISYQYNSENYPTQANHTFDESESNYTETFEYY